LQAHFENVSAFVTYWKLIWKERSR